MRRGFPIILCTIALMTILLVGSDSTPARVLSQGGAPTMVSYQGQVRVGGQPYSGTGHFKFAIVDAAGAISYWSNDGTSSAGA